MPPSPRSGGSDFSPAFLRPGETAWLTCASRQRRVNPASNVANATEASNIFRFPGLERPG